MVLVADLDIVQRERASDVPVLARTAPHFVLGVASNKFNLIQRILHKRLSGTGPGWMCSPLSEYPA